MDGVVGADASDLTDLSRERVIALVSDSLRDHRLPAYHDRLRRSGSVLLNL